jgi:hypothetical protein
MKFYKKIGTGSQASVFLYKKKRLLNYQACEKFEQLYMNTNNKQ